VKTKKQRERRPRRLPWRTTCSLAKADPILRALAAAVVAHNFRHRTPDVTAYTAWRDRAEQELGLTAANDVYWGLLFGATVPWVDSGEGSFDTEETAREFAEAECGVPWCVQRGKAGAGWVIRVLDVY
jgi:hypothetical protein